MKKGSVGRCEGKHAVLLEDIIFWDVYLTTTPITVTCKIYIVCLLFCILMPSYLFCLYLFVFMASFNSRDRLCVYHFYLDLLLRKDSLNINLVFRS